MWCLYCNEGLRADDKGEWLDWDGSWQCYADDNPTGKHVPEIGIKDEKEL